MAKKQGGKVIVYWIADGVGKVIWRKKLTTTVYQYERRGGGGGGRGRKRERERDRERDRDGQTATDNLTNRK